jgi:iron(III) transport system substrate-binding protein
MEYKSPEQSQLPKWAVWKDKAYGTTYEPVVFIYNKRLIPAGDVPDSHAALAKLIASQTDKFKGKVTTYDIEKSGLGFMLSVQDHNADPNYFKTLADVAKGGLSVQSSTGTMMERVSSGENLIGFNILGSYAEARAKNDPSLGISYQKITPWCCRACRSSASNRKTATPLSCGWTMCCLNKGKTFWPIRRIFPPFVTISKGKMISTA